VTPVPNVHRGIIRAPAAFGAERHAVLPDLDDEIAERYATPQAPASDFEDD